MVLQIGGSGRCRLAAKLYMHRSTPDQFTFDLQQQQGQLKLQEGGHNITSTSSCLEQQLVHGQEAVSVAGVLGLPSGGATAVQEFENLAFQGLIVEYFQSNQPAAAAALPDDELDSAVQLLHWFIKTATDITYVQDVWRTSLKVSNSRATTSSKQSHSQHDPHDVGQLM